MTFKIYSKKIATNRGLVRTIVLIIALLILFAYFGLNLRSIVSGETFLDNWSFVKSTVTHIWSNYLSVPINYFWTKVFVPYFWEPVVDNLRSKV